MICICNDFGAGLGRGGGWSAGFRFWQGFELYRSFGVVFPFGVFLHRVFFVVWWSCLGFFLLIFVMVYV